MANNELDEDIPPDVEAEAKRLSCQKSVKYVYRDGHYPTKGPAASIDCAKRAIRLTRYPLEQLKVALGSGYVAFKSPNSVASALVAAPQPAGELPSLPRSRIGTISRRKKVDGSPLVFRVDEDDVFAASSNSRKAYLLQKVRVDDGEGFVQGHDEYRIAYYMIGHRPRARGKWAFGQYAPMMTLADVTAILRRMREKGWLQGDDTAALLEQ